MVAGNSKEIRKVAEMLDKQGANLQKAYQERSGKSVEELAAMMDEETWLTADESVAMGFADGKIEDVAAAAFVIPSSFGFKHPPSSSVVQPEQRFQNDIASRQRRIDLARALARNT
jgi:hypothetical protein